MAFHAEAGDEGRGRTDPRAHRAREAAAVAAGGRVAGAGVGRTGARVTASGGQRFASNSSISTFPPPGFSARKKFTRVPFAPSRGSGYTDERPKRPVTMAVAVRTSFTGSSTC